MSDTLEIATVGRLRVLRLNRPDRKNALNSELSWSVINAVRDAAHDDEVWAVAITGNGDAFCSGLDLGPSDGPQPKTGLSRYETAHDDLGWVGRLCMAFRSECEKPIVAGVNGVAVGAGMSMAMAADIRIASPSARFHPGYARVGTSPDAGLTWTLTTTVGYERALRFLLEQRMVGAEEALAIGLVSEIVPEGEDFEERFLSYATQLSEVAPIAARQTKRMLLKVVSPPDLVAHLREEVRNAMHGLQSEDAQEAMRAMAAKDRPTFTGR